MQQGTGREHRGRERALEAGSEQRVVQAGGEIGVCREHNVVQRDAREILRQILRHDKRVAYGMT